MSKKFTEEQYKKLCGIDLSNWKINKDKAVQFHNSEEGYIALAIANPLTREWAHNKFVEKEKKYYWTNKKGNRVGLYKENGIIVLEERFWDPLTESEIREWGYNPEMFDREEIK